MNKLSLEELEYLYAKFRISCPTDGVLAKRIEGKLVTEINERKANEAECERLNKVFAPMKITPSNLMA